MFSIFSIYFNPLGISHALDSIYQGNIPITSKGVSILFKKHIKHIGLWDVKARPPPRANALPKYELYIDYSASKLPVSDNLSRASSSNEWLYVDPEYPETYTG